VDENYEFLLARTRSYPAQLMMPGTGKMSVMVMATAAKKHVTIFRRSRSAPGAGSPDIKARFTQAAHATVGNPDRASRNASISAALGGKRGGRRVARSRSRAREMQPA
jgi:hypothetical protein